MSVSCGGFAVASDGDERAFPAALLDSPATATALEPWPGEPSEVSDAMHDKDCDTTMLRVRRCDRISASIAAGPTRAFATTAAGASADHHDESSYR
jgi:hypothetical protein